MQQIGRIFSIGSNYFAIKSHHFGDGLITRAVQISCKRGKLVMPEQSYER